MKLRVRLLPVLILAATACDRPREGERHDVAREEPIARAEPHVEPAPAERVSIDPEMLRDLRITTAQAESRAAGEGVTVLGEVKVNEDAYAEVGVAIAARVLRALASPGERVEPGQPLALLESSELGRARAAYEVARGHARLAERALARKRELFTERIVAGRELQEAEAEAAAAEAELRAARGMLTALGVEGDESESEGLVESRFRLRAPIAGTVLERNFVQGQMTEAGTPLFRIAELSKLWLTVHAFERDAVRVRPGTAARIAFSALPGRPFSGTVALVGGQVDTSSRTIPIRVDVENPDGALRPGMSATAWLPLGDAGAPVIAVPVAALQRTQEGWSVFLPRDGASFELRRVGRGRDLGGEVEVLSGLAAGETVVVEGAFLLKAEAEKARGEGEHHDH